MSEFRVAKHNFSPVIEKDSRMLFLGSVPSVASEKAGFFYMHKTNRFWRILGEIFGENFYDASIEQKISLLKKHRVALYDSIESCEISGSSDSTIKNVVPADIPALLSLSEIKRIFCVGTASRKYLLEFYPELSPLVSVLPSPSAANAKYSLALLTEIWRAEIAKHFDVL